VLPRSKHVPKHRLDRTGEIGRRSVRRLVTLTGAAAAVTGLAVSAGVVLTNQASADATTTISAAQQDRRANTIAAPRAWNASRAPPAPIDAPPVTNPLGRRSGETTGRTAATGAKPRKKAKSEDKKRKAVSQDPRTIARNLVPKLSLASVMGPPRCHEHGTTWRCQRASADSGGSLGCSPRRDYQRTSAGLVHRPSS